MHRQDTPQVEIKPRDLVCAPVAKQFKNSQPFCFRDTPGKHKLAAHAVLKLLFTLKHQDSRSAFRHRTGERGAPQTSPHHNEIVLLRHDRLLPNPCLLHPGQSTPSTCATRFN